MLAKVYWINVSEGLISVSGDGINKIATQGSDDVRNVQVIPRGAAWRRLYISGISTLGNPSLNVFTAINIFRSPDAFKDEPNTPQGNNLTRSTAAMTVFPYIRSAFRITSFITTNHTQSSLLFPWRFNPRAVFNSLSHVKRQNYADFMLMLD